MTIDYLEIERFKKVVQKALCVPYTINFIYSPIGTLISDLE